jgi:hypothetical protein
MGTTLPIGEQTRERLEDLRDDGFRSWDAFVNFLADEHERYQEQVDDPNSGEIVARLDRLEDGVATVEERTGEIERTLEEVTRR